MQEPYDVTGHVNIQLEVAEDTPCIVLHSEGMYLGEVSLDGVEQPGGHLSTLQQCEACLTFDNICNNIACMWYATVFQSIYACCFALACAWVRL